MSEPARGEPRVPLSVLEARTHEKQEWRDKWFEQRDRLEAAERRVQGLESALRFYADPDTYFAIGVMGDPPCGEFLDDFENLGGEGNLEDWKPGKRARSVLSEPRQR